MKKFRTGHINQGEYGLASDSDQTNATGTGPGDIHRKKARRNLQGGVGFLLTDLPSPRFRLPLTLFIDQPRIVPQGMRDALEWATWVAATDVLWAGQEHDPQLILRLKIGLNFWGIGPSTGGCLLPGHPQTKRNKPNFRCDVRAKHIRQGGRSPSLRVCLLGPGEGDRSTGGLDGSEGDWRLLSPLVPGPARATVERQSHMS
jgi:hypothetical protein